MAKNEGKGSIILKLLIVVLVIVLVAVIIIPGKIWKQEAQEQKTAQDNMSSIYEAEKFYYKLNDKFTDKPEKLLAAVRKDSSLIQLQQVVNYTRELAREIDRFLGVDLVKALGDINQNLQKIDEDLQSNRRNFKAFEDINNEAEELRMKIRGLNNSHDYPNYVQATVYLDSLVQLRRNMSDFTLQICASKTKYYTDTLQKVLGKIEIRDLENSWGPLSERLDKFVRKVNHSQLVHVTSVGDRVKDFKKVVDTGFEKLKNIKVEAALAQTAKANKMIDAKYQKFLNDFIITGKTALYKLSEADSLVLHLTEDNFYSPVTNELYKIILDKDSAAVKVESPVLLKECQEKAAPLVSDMKTLPILKAFGAYLDSLHSIKDRTYRVRKRFRKNTDMFIDYKEIETLVGKFDGISVVKAYNDCKVFANQADSTQSYSDLKTYTENALNGIRIFKQAYQKNFFGNLDSLHRDLQNSYVHFDSLINSIRRRPKDITDFKEDMAFMNKQLENIKSLASPDLNSKLANMEKGLVDLFLFESEGKRVPVYGVFRKDIKNFGYIYADTKSWEEKKEKK